MSNLKIYPSYDYALQHEIVDKLEAKGLTDDAHRDYDIEGIGSEVFRYDSINGREGFRLVVDRIAFWQAVESNLRPQT